MELVCEYCREHRINTLGLSLTNFSELTRQNLKNIHAFEKGRANNIKYLFCYYVMTDECGRERFLTGLFELYKEVDNKWKKQGN